MDSIDAAIMNELHSDKKYNEDWELCSVPNNSSYPTCYDIRNVSGINYDTPVLH